MNEPLVPSNFKVPQVLETDRFKLRMLTINDVDKDYEAVMSSVGHLRGVFGPYSRWANWPPSDLTLEQDLIELGWHQMEFQMKSSFAYTVMSLDESQCLGCVYIFRSTRPSFDAEIYLWVRKSEYDKGLDPIFFKTVKKWIKEKWPFKKIAYPGREIDWETWESIK